MQATLSQAHGWTWLTIGELCAEDRTIVEPASELARALPYLGMEHVESITGSILRDVATTMIEGRSTTFRFDSRHVLYGKLRPYLNKVALPNFDGRCTTELIPLLPGAGVSRDFLAWLLRRPQTVEAAMREKTGARMPRANLRHVLSLKVLVPEQIDEQQRIANTINGRMKIVCEAKAACYEQINLLNAYAQKTLAAFPGSASSDESDEGDHTDE